MKNVFIKISKPIASWINKGGWFHCCILGIIGIVMCSIGMVMTLINLAKDDLTTFLTCLIIDIIVWITAIIGIFGIIRIIKNNKDIFNI